VPRLVERLTGLRTPLTVLGAGHDEVPGLAAVLPRPPDPRLPTPWDELPGLADAVRQRSPARRSAVHGPRHWLTVAWIGAALAAKDPDVDPVVVALFALFHDCARVHDGHDREHGRRGAGEARALLTEASWVAPGQVERLVEACCLHTDGLTTSDATIGACWDADRLDLWRVGATPRSDLFSHPVAPGLTEWSRRFGRVGGDDVAWDDWRPIAAVYAGLASRPGPPAQSSPGR